MRLLLLRRVGECWRNKRCPGVVAHGDAGRIREGSGARPDGQQKVPDVGLGDPEVEVRVAGQVDFHYELVDPHGRSVSVWPVPSGTFRDGSVEVVVAEVEE